MSYELESKTMVNDRFVWRRTLDKPRDTLEEISADLQDKTFENYINKEWISYRIVEVV